MVRSHGLLRSRGQYHRRRFGDYTASFPLGTAGKSALSFGAGGDPTEYALAFLRALPYPPFA